MQTIIHENITPFTHETRNLPVPRTTKSASATNHQLMRTTAMTERSPPPTSRRFSPIPMETTVKKVRRFAVEPVETSTRSSKKEDIPPDNGSAVETKDFAPAKRRFVPEPVETTFKSNRQAVHSLPTPELTPASIPRDSPPAEAPKARRKFTPELIETTKRTKKAGDTRPATLPTDKTDLTPGVPNIYTRTKYKSRPAITPLPKEIGLTPDNTPSTSSGFVPTLPPYPPRRQGSMKPHLNTRRSTRQDSFQPELDDIPSSESDGEDTPSLTQSQGTSSEDSEMRLRLARTRESCDDRFSGYLLALAAKAAEKQLREQALAAFPNESTYQIVEHFYDREVEGGSDDDGDVEGIGMLLHDSTLDILPIRRKSTDIGWAAREMQQHQEKLAKQREEETEKKIAAEAQEPSFKDPFWTNGMTAKARPQNAADRQKEAELERMRSAASPPMLGGDLKFRMWPSPKATKFETDQRMDAQPHRSENGGGLWGGYCVADEPDVFLSPNTLKSPALIQTPATEPSSDPFASAFASGIPSGAKTPGKKNNGQGGVRMLAGLDERLQAEISKAKAEEAILAEFDDTFVTQVYNYLSLGYPALARQYDAELARISRIAESELKVDDYKGAAKGYINITNVEGKVEMENKEVYCARWKALRIYILEWARQHPIMSNGAMGPSAWGVRARRGSWAI